uniref:VIT domain-containing protein n=1 Tax=Plectus sambesii TaxID=2011161 RepID=A0A914XBS5_9BILA
MTLTKKLNITKLHINTEVQCRFATTEINSRVENVSEKAEEAEFVANLPEGAFITYFEMYGTTFFGCNGDGEFPVPRGFPVPVPVPVPVPAPVPVPVPVPVPGI